jgi:hypothetical protein
MAEFAVCDQCGQWYHAAWHALNVLWNALRGDDDLLCPDCFTKRAAGADIRLCWLVEVTEVAGEVLGYQQPCSLGHWHHEGILNAPDPETGT